MSTLGDMKILINAILTDNNPEAMANKMGFTLKGGDLKNLGTVKRISKNKKKGGTVKAPAKKMMAGGKAKKKK